MHPRRLPLAFLCVLGRPHAAAARIPPASRDAREGSSPRKAPPREAVSADASVNAGHRALGDGDDPDYDPGDLPAGDAPREPASYVDRQWSEDPHAGADHLEQLKRGELGLAAISFGPNSFVDTDGDQNMYADVYGEFCAYDASSNKDDPASKATMNELMAQSHHCSEHSYTIDMNEAMDAVNTYDAMKNSGVTRVPLTSIIAHEGHAGAGLLSNVLSTFDDTIVYSEHPALRDALSACDTLKNRYLQESCDDGARLRLVTDVVTVLSRTTNPKLEEMHVKLNSESGSYLHDLTSLYPDAHWAFVYRDAYDALSGATEGRRKKNCVRARRNPSKALAARAADEGIDLEQLSNEEVCALHLSTLMDAAAAESKGSGKGALISYDADIVGRPENVVNDILPGLGRNADKMSLRARAKAQEVLATKSNTAGNRSANGSWNAAESKSRRRRLITDEIIRASDLFMRDSMEALQRVAGRS